MIVPCPPGGCARKMRVGLANSSTYYEERAALDALSQTCPRHRSPGAECAAAKQFALMSSNHPETADAEDYVPA